MTNLLTAVAAVMPSWAYFDRAPREQPAYYAVYTVDTLGVDDTASLLHSVQITVDAFARDTTTLSAAEVLSGMAAVLDAALVRGHLAATGGSSSLVVLGERSTQRDPEDEGVSWMRSVYTTTWSTT